MFPIPVSGFTNSFRYCSRFRLLPEFSGKHTYQQIQQRLMQQINQQGILSDQVQERCPQMKNRPRKHFSLFHQPAETDPCLKKEDPRDQGKIIRREKSFHRKARGCQDPAPCTFPLIQKGRKRQAENRSQLQISPVHPSCHMKEKGTEQNPCGRFSKPAC